MLMLSRIRDHLSHFGLGNFIGKDAAHSFTLRMDLQHNASCFGSVHSKESLQDIDDKLHRSEVVIDQHDLKQRRTLELGRRFFDDQTRSVSTTFVITHQISVYRARPSALQGMSPPASSRCNCRQLVSCYFNK